MAHIQLIGVSTAAMPNGVINSFPYAFPIIIAALRKTRHTFAHVDTHLDRLTPQQLLARIDGMDAKIYGISAWSHNYLQVKEIAARIRRRHPDATIIVGGVLSGNDEVLLNRTETDIVSTAAEGEHVLPEILDALDEGAGLARVAGISFKDPAGGRIVRTPKRQVMTKSEFDAEDFPAYDYFDPYLKDLFAVLNARADVPVKGFPLLTMRGCPFPCTFCGQLYGRHLLRKKWDRFFDEVEIFVDRYGLEGVYCLDNNLFLNERDVEDYCRTYRERGATFKLVCSLRLSFGTKEMFSKLYDHGLRVCLFGFESGSQKMLDNMKKGVTVGKMYEVMGAAMDAGLFIHGNFLFGTPGENWRTLWETREMMIWMERRYHAQKREKEALGLVGSSGYQWSMLVPSPTSELYRVCRDNGLIADEEAYLETLSDDRMTRLLPGSNFKIALSQGINDVNMSEFSSTRALHAAIMATMASVKMAAPTTAAPRLRAAASAAGWLARWAAISVADYLAGRRGFQPAPQPRAAHAGGCA